MADNRARAAVDHLIFLGRFLRSPRTVGAIAPSSRFLADRMVAGLSFEAGTTVVELGPGTGAFTRAISERLPAGGRYLGIERDQVFVGILRRRWPELDYVCDSVEHLERIARTKGILPIDHIVSGLPFATLPAVVTRPVLDAVHSTLRPGGTFTTFQYVHAYPMPAARLFRRQMAERFGPRAAREAVYRNIPPAFVLTWRKGG